MRLLPWADDSNTHHKRDTFGRQSVMQRFGAVLQELVAYNWEQLKQQYILICTMCIDITPIILRRVSIHNVLRQCSNRAELPSDKWQKMEIKPHNTMDWWVLCVWLVSYVGLFMYRSRKSNNSWTTHGFGILEIPKSEWNANSKFWIQLNNTMSWLVV